MKKILFSLFFLPALAQARNTTIWNPYTSNLDFINAIDTNTTISVKSITFPDGTVQVSSPTTGSSFTPNSTFYVQNTLTPTTTSQVFEVQTSSVNGNLSVTGHTDLIGNSNKTPFTVTGFGGFSPIRVFNNTAQEIFSVNNAGDLEIAKVSYAWPLANAKGFLFNDGGGGLSWTTKPVIIAQVPYGGFSKSFDASLSDALTLNVSASTAFDFEAVLFVDADATGGTQFAIGGTATVLSGTNPIFEVMLQDETTGAYTIFSRQTALATGVGQSGTTQGVCTIRGSIQVDVAGTLTVQFAQNSPNNASTIAAGSTFKAFPMGASSGP